MSEFRTRMPKGNPPKDEAFVVVSVRQHDGTRLELTATLPQEVATHLLNMAMHDVNKRNEEGGA